ncbi:hypothetical protein GQ53DRAFT_600923, partial [Thozetella sp. PMI_491]
MSGRSAYVRKKITETKVDKAGLPRSRAKSTTSSEDNATIHDYPMPARGPDRHQDRDRDITGVGTTNARFLKFPEPVRETESMNFRSEIAAYNHSGNTNNSGGSQSGDSLNGRSQTATPQLNRPLEDFAYARARRPVIKTEDVSGIEKSGLRSILDKKSDEVRKGLAKTFTFSRKKDKREADLDRALEFRPQSSATVRPHGAAGGYTSDPDLPHETHQAYIGPPSAPLQGEQSWDGSGPVSPPPSMQLPAIPMASTPPIKRWIGAGRPVQRWNKLRKDPELWDPNGDVLVFFGHKGQSPRPNPSFRLSSHIIEATESRFLVTLLREGSTEEDIHLPPSPIGAPPMLQRHGQYLNPRGPGFGPGGQPTPPVSEDTSFGEADGQISYEMFFPSPANGSKMDQLRHHITTRNVFALLYHASLVGFSLYQAISDLHMRLEGYMPIDADNVGTIINYLSARGIDDVRNEPEGAVSLLAWSEGAEVRWDEGWREAFLHCAGMYSQLEYTADFRHVTPITRALLERACLETQLRVQAAEERLAEFEYSDMWPDAATTTASASGPVMIAPAKAAAERLQKFLIQHYTRRYGRWPPLPPAGDQQAIGTAHSGMDGEEEVWLTRTVAQALQQDFAALYDYLVNRDVKWDGSEARSGRKWMMVSKTGNKSFEPDTTELPMTDMLVEFDNRLRFPHIPHPFPLVPESIPAMPRPNANGRAGAMERRIQLAYTEATNICILGSDFTHSELTEAFGKFEKSDHVGGVDPSTARLGRWTLLYGILQTLASVSVDAPNMRYREGVIYHLSPRLKGAKVPPWKSSSSSQPIMEEAVHELSHCWLAPREWTASNPNSAAESSADEDLGWRRRKENFSFPKPPSSSVGGRSSAMGYHTPAATRAPSLRSSSS